MIYVLFSTEGFGNDIIVLSGASCAGCERTRGASRFKLLTRSTGAAAGCVL